MFKLTFFITVYHYLYHRLSEHSGIRKLLSKYKKKHRTQKECKPCFDKLQILLITEKLLKYPVYLLYWTSVILRLVQHKGWLTLAWLLVSATCLISGQALIALILLFTRNLGFGHLPLAINLGWTFYYIHALYIKCHLCLEVQKKINIYPWSWNDTQVDLHYHHARQNIIVCCKYNGTH